MKTIYYTIIILSTFIMAWVLTNLYHLTTDKASKNIFTYYSSVEKSFCAIDFDEINRNLVRKNMKTNDEYTESQFDSILPMFYYRQLLSEGRMPDSIHGFPVSPKQIRNKSFFYRYNPANKNKPYIPLYTLFESMSGRVNIEMPGDVFRLKNKIEFINPETNSVNKEKSKLFMKEFMKRKFKFPAKLAVGNPSTRKAYDEGYFITDSNNNLFHLKMVNGKPFLRKIPIPLEIKPVYISVMEPNDRSFYAFVFDEKNKLYIISTDKYKLVEIPCPEFDINKNKILIMANLLYWNINVLSKEGKTAYAIKADTKEIVDTLIIKRSTEKKNLSHFIFPFELKFESTNSKYIKPVIKPGNPLVLILNLIFLTLFLIIIKYQKRKIKPMPVIWIALTGIFGFIPCIILYK